MGTTALASSSPRATGTSAAFTGLAITALHAGLVAALLVATGPSCRDLCLSQADERGPLSVWLISASSALSHPGADGTHDGVSDLLCAHAFEVDERGNLYQIGPPSEAFLHSLPSGSDGNFPRIGITCPSPMRPPTPFWSKLEPRPRSDQSTWEPQDPNHPL
jgi:hypothetical protein